MDAVRVPDVIAGPAQVLHQLEGPLSKSLQAEALLVQCLREVRVQTYAVTPRQLGRLADPRRGEQGARQRGAGAHAAGQPLADDRRPEAASPRPPTAAFPVHT